MNNNEVRIYMNAEFRNKCLDGEIKAIHFVQYIIDKTNATTDKDINETAIIDLKVNGRKVINAIIDNSYDDIVLQLEDKEEIKEVDTIATGLKFTDGMREYEIIEFMSQFNMYRLKNYTENRESEIMKKEEIQKYIDNKEVLNARLEKGKQRRLEREKEIELQRIEEEKKEKEYNNVYGYLDNKSNIQRGKILKCLNMEIMYHKELTTRKKIIHDIIKNNKNVFVKEEYKTNRVSKKRIQLEYKDLVDKTEYNIYFNEGNTWLTVTKTEYLYCKYLLENNIKID